ncbi:putative sporulation protein YtxC [Bacillota bacterium LX-D]|nr:putative sporulation protein YtxC [Bacillota bacterium LX-D]
MSLISIGTTRHIDFIRNKLDDELKLLQAEGVEYNLQEKASGDYTFLGYNIVPKTKTDKGGLQFKHFLAQVISEVVVSKWEENLIKGIIKSSYSYFTEEEKQNIFDKTLQFLADEDNLLRKNRILLKIAEYLETHDDLIIDGFIKFRLKEYVSELEEAVDSAVDSFLMEKEYNEFIRLLRHFVEMQDTKVQEVHVLLKPSGYFQLYDAKQNVITNEYLEDFVVDLYDTDINYEDLLISALITTAPQQIVLHLPDMEEVKNTIKIIDNVFGERVVICPGCSKCREE